MKTLTKEEILKDTIEFYGADPKERRGYDELTSSCVYKTPDGRNCALGRKMTKEAIAKLELDDKLNESASDLMLPIDYYLLPECHGHNAQFWVELQGLHDSSYVWSDHGSGLSLKGLDRLNEMCMKFNLDINKILTPEQINSIYHYGIHKENQISAIL